MGLQLLLEEGIVLEKLFPLIFKLLEFLGDAVFEIVVLLEETVVLLGVVVVVVPHARARHVLVSVVVVGVELGGGVGLGVGLVVVGSALLPQHLFPHLHLPQLPLLVLQLLPLQLNEDFLFGQLPEVLVQLRLHPVDFLGEAVDLSVELKLHLDLLLQVLLEGVVLLLQLQFDQLVSLQAALILFHLGIYQIVGGPFGVLSPLSQLLLKHLDFHLKGAKEGSLVEQIDVPLGKGLPGSPGLPLGPVPQLFDLPLHVLVPPLPVLNLQGEPAPLVLKFPFPALQLLDPPAALPGFFLQLLFASLELLDRPGEVGIFAVSFVEFGPQLLDGVVEVRRVLPVELSLLEFELQGGDIIAEGGVLLLLGPELAVKILYFPFEPFVVPFQLGEMALVLLVDLGHHQLPVFSQFLLVELQPLHQPLVVLLLSVQLHLQQGFFVVEVGHCLAESVGRVAVLGLELGNLVLEVLYLTVESVLFRPEAGDRLVGLEVLAPF